MKCLHLPLNVPGSEQIGQRNGLKKVFDEVVELDYLNIDDPNDKLVELAKEGFDIGFFQLQETGTITPETLEKIKPYFKLLVQWQGDIREVVPEYQQKIGKYFDITYLGFDHIRQYEPYCNEVKTMMIAIDGKEVIPEEQEKKYDLVFAGNHYNQFPDTKFRTELINVLRQKFNTKVYGFGWNFETETCPVKEQGKRYREGRVCLSINHFNDVKYYSERLLWCLASGTPTVVKRTPELEFEENKHYLGFDDVNECVRQINLLLQYPEKGEQIAKEARKEILKNHTWTSRAKQLKGDYVESQHR